MSRARCTVALDLGTTTFKAAAFSDADGRRIAAARLRLGVSSDERGAAVQDPRPAYEGIIGLLEQVVAESRHAGFDVARVGCSAAMHGVMAVDASNEPVTPVLTWMDTRAAGEAGSLWASADGRALYARTGTPVHAMSPLVKLVWLRAHRGDLWEGGVRFVSLKEWIWRRWFGEWCVDRATASATGLYALATHDWDPAALVIAGLDPSRLSAVVPVTHLRSNPADERLRALLPRTPFVVGATDGVLANLAANGIDGRGLVLTIGTSLAARTGAIRPVTHEPTRSFCYVLKEDRFVVGAASNSGGVLLDWLWAGMLGSAGRVDAPDLGVLLAQAGEVDAGDLVCLPYVAGERAPLWDANAAGALVGLRRSHGAIHIVRAAVEGILFNARWISGWLLEGPAPPVEVITAGRPFGQPWIRQLAADVFALPVRDAGTVDASLYGAAALARIATGDFGWADVRSWVPPPGPVQAPAPGDVWRDKYARFRQVAARLGPGGA